MRKCRDKAQVIYSLTKWLTGQDGHPNPDLYVVSHIRATLFHFQNGPDLYKLWALHYCWLNKYMFFFRQNRPVFQFTVSFDIYSQISITKTFCP